MKKIVLITELTPTIDNYNGPSAMMYHLMKHRPEGFFLRIYTMNRNAVIPSEIRKTAAELDCEIIQLNDGIRNYFHRRHTFADIRIVFGIDKSYGEGNYKLRKNTLQQIFNFNPDIVWVYNEKYTTISRQLCHFNLLICGYDCMPLHYNRLLNDGYCFLTPKRYLKALYEYKAHIYWELEQKEIRAKLYVVGINDAVHYRTITGRDDIIFYPHPHFSLQDKIISFDKKKLSILISGQYNEYTYTDSNQMCETLIKNKNILRDKFTITFLGKKWEPIVSALQDNGYTICHKIWVDKYATELTTHDIQIFPISVGSGTKGKVLDALSTGLLCIGSKIAMENIYVKHMHSCIQYDIVTDIGQILNDIYENRDLFQKIAEQGKLMVRHYHNPSKICELILNNTINNIQYDGIDEYVKAICTL